MGLILRRQGLDWRTAGSPFVRAGLTVALAGLFISGGLTVAGQHPLLQAAIADWQPDQTDKLVDLDLANADLHAVVAAVQQQTGAQIVVQDGAQPFGRVNVHLHGAPLSEVLKYIAVSANAVVSRDDQGVYVFRSGDFLQPDATPARPATDQYHYYKLVLQHAVPTDVLYLLHWDQDVRTINPYSQLPQLDGSTPPQPTPPVMMFNQDGSTSPVPGSTPSVPGARGGVGANAANRSVEESGDEDQAHQFPGGFPGNGGGFGQPGGGGFNGGAGGFPQQQFGTGAAGNRQGGNGGLPDGVDHIYALQGDNSLLIHATPEAFARIREIVRNLDIAPRQVQIKIEFVTANVGVVDSFGVQYSLIPYPGVTAQSVLSGTGSDSYQINFAYGNLVAQMEAELTDSVGKVVESPMLTTTNNVAATIQFTTQIPYQTTTNITGTTGTVSNTQEQFLTVPTGISINPRINSDDTVTMVLNPQISTVGEASPTGGPPPVSTESVQTLRTVHSGDTMVLGGLVNKSELNAVTRIPFLSDLPLIGSAFRNRNKSVSDSELLIFVTPTIIEDESTEAASGPSGSDTGSVSP